ncbi:hypothetical protein FD09_GL000048 [Schleiferilactobacillus perolens DSM 12744]|uniref:Uncharacterized protein n=1 Tax=Schleiferilactobacillus perolens DSM 12744 TaxID=1423792 RepID=A0A0R1N2M8_9LACO|nr:hypothetical protein FD09_GL000048 [Schleiferilactobacillus perolens DSM 12744]
MAVVKTFFKKHKVFALSFLFLVLLLLYSGATLAKHQLYDTHRAYEDSLTILARHGFKKSDITPLSSVHRDQSFFGEPVIYSFEFVTKDSMHESKQYLRKHERKTTSLTAENARVYYHVFYYKATDKMAQSEHITGWVLYLSKANSVHDEEYPNPLQ